MSATMQNAAALPAGAKWIGRNITSIEATAVLFVGTVGILIAGLQPLLLGALAQEARLTAVQLGQAATAELLMIGISVGVAGAVLRPVKLRWWAIGASLALALIDAITGGETGYAIVANRAAAGVAEGVMLWIPVSMIARSVTPDRWSGIFLTVQTLAQLGLSALLPMTVMIHYGATGGFMAMAAAAVLSALVGLAVPASFEALPKHPQGEAGLGAASPRALAVLASVFLYMAFIVGLWAYFEPLSAQAHHPADVYGIAVSVSLGGQVAGGFVATLVAGRVPYFPIVIGCTLVDFIVLGVLATMPGPVVFIGLAAVFGFFWLFLMPFQVPLAVEADPTRKAAVLLSGAQLLGASTGPFLCSFAVNNHDVRGALAVCAGSLALGFAVVVWLHWHTQGRKRT
jgi:hypothetical protein